MNQCYRDREHESLTRIWKFIPIIVIIHATLKYYKWGKSLIYLTLFQDKCERRFRVRGSR